MVEISEIVEKIQKTLADSKVYVKNPNQDGLHFEATVVSSFFKGKSLVEQHQIVMGSLKELFASSLHALSLKTYTPNEWKKESIK